jgi:hypothetical protein
MDAIGRDAGNSTGLDSRRHGRSWLSVRPSGAWIMQGEGFTSDSNERLVRKATDLSMSIHLSHLRMLSTVAYMTVNSYHA